MVNNLRSFERSELERNFSFRVAVIGHSGIFAQLAVKFLLSVQHLKIFPCHVTFQI